MGNQPDACGIEQMPYNGQTISDYTVVHGFTPSSYDAELTAIKAYITPSTTSVVGRLTDTLYSQVGLDYIHRFQPADPTKNLGGESFAKDPLGTLIEKSRDMWKEGRETAATISSLTNRMKDVARDVAIATAQYSVADDYVSHDTAVMDRGRVELESRQTTEQAHRTTESSYSRTQQTTIQNDRQAWDAGESVLDRSAETTYQDADQSHRTSESAYARSQRLSLLSDQHLWIAAESLLDRNLDLSLQDDEQSFNSTEAGYVRTQKSDIQNDRQSWESAESLLDRGAETTLQDNDQTHRSSEAAYARSLNSSLASDQHLWLAAESLADRTLTVNLQTDDLSHKGTEAGYARTHKLTMQNDRQAWAVSESGLDRAAETNLQNTVQTAKEETAADMRTAEAVRNIKQLNADYSTREFAFPGFLSFYLFATDTLMPTNLATWWEPQPVTMLDMLYSGSFYRGLHLCTAEDWTDPGE